MVPMSTDTAPETVTRLVGFCAYCERDIKLTPDGRLVHHGYQRPGDGAIHGDCRLVHAAPFEVSAEPLRPILADVREALATERAYLDRLVAGEVHHLTRRFREWRGPSGVATFSRFVSDRYVFDTEERNAIHASKGNVAHLAREIDRLTRWIETWTAKPIRTVEELARIEAEDKAAKAAAKAAKNAAKAAAKAAREAKADALAARKAAEFEAIVAEALSLAERKAAGEDIAKPAAKLRSLMKRSNSWTAWGIEKSAAADALVAIGLAERTEGRWFRVLL